MVRSFPLFLSVALVVGGCSYVAGEASANYTASQGQTIGYVQNRPLSSTLTGHGVVLGAGLILSPVLGAWASKMIREDIMRLTYDCLYRRGSTGEEDVKVCGEEAKKREDMRLEYFYKFYGGACRQWWNPFSAFKKCWNESFSYLEKEGGEGDLKEKVRQMYEDRAYLKCMPDIEDYKDKEALLEKKYLECKEKARREADKEMEKVAPKIEEYLKKKEKVAG